MLEDRDVNENWGREAEVGNIFNKTSRASHCGGEDDISAATNEMRMLEPTGNSEMRRNPESNDMISSE